ncbi:MAG TPA: flippase-like domain-containing protein [Armatimonadetes bacterium]|nr:flippase-like domain-containing protein [Armatimonadota bacterium]
MGKDEVVRVSSSQQNLETAAQPAGRNVWHYALRAALSAVALGLLFLKFPPREVGQALRAVPGRQVAAAIGVYAGLQLFSALKWQVVLDGLGSSALWRNLARLYFVGMFSNFFLPTCVGGDAVRTYLLARRQGEWERPALSVLVERFTGFVALMGLGVVGAWGVRMTVGGAAQRWLEAGMGLVVVGLAGSLMLMGLPRWTAWLPQRGRRVLARLSAGMRQLVRQPRRLALLGGMSVAFQLGVTGLNAWLGWLCGVHLSASVWLLAVPLITLASLLPTLGGLGVREAASVVVLTPFGVSAPRALAYSLLWQAVLLLTSLPGGWLWWEGG